MVDGNKTSAEWTESEKSHYLTGTIMNAGSKIVLKVSSVTKGDRLFNLLSGDKDFTGYAYLSADGAKMYLMLAKDDEVSFQIFTRGI